MLDAGIHPAYTGPSALPFFDEIEDPSSIDLLLVSQCAFVSCPAKYLIHSAFTLTILLRCLIFWRRLHSKGECS